MTRSSRLRFRQRVRKYQHGGMVIFLCRRNRLGETLSPSFFLSLERREKVEGVKRIRRGRRHTVVGGGRGSDARAGSCRGQLDELRVCCTARCCWISRSKGQSVINEVVCPRPGCKKMKFPSRKHRGALFHRTRALSPVNYPGLGEACVVKVKWLPRPPGGPRSTRVIYPTSLSSMAGRSHRG